MSFNEGAELDTSQVEDMRGSGGGGGMAGGGMAGGGMAGGGGGFSFPGGGMGMGGGIAGLIILLLAGFLGATGNLPGTGGENPPAQDLREECAASNPQRFQRTDCRNVLYVNSIQAYWKQALPQSFGKPYQAATTRFFSGGVSTACGNATSGVGPFYCPADRHVYIDLSFYDELASRFGAPGQFAQAYVLAHEYGHHVQTLLGTEAQMRRAQQRDPANANRYSVMLELQADCYAGAWAAHAAQTTDTRGDPLFQQVTQQEINEALQAAAAVGDDSIQQKSGGGVNQDSWTHGSSAQRQQWFNQGYRSGDPTTCNTFGSAL